MSNFLYNGVELPGLPETWNEAAHPHLFIRVVSLDGSAENAVYSLFAASAAAVSYDDNGILVPSSAVGEKYAVSDGAWVESSESLSDAFYIKRNDGFLYTLWANFDILNSDGSVYIAASEPVPVVEKFPIREWMGWLIAGLCSRPLPMGAREPVAWLYNGVRLPGLPEWDRVKYPYGTIIRITVGENQYNYLFICTDAKFISAGYSFSPNLVIIGTEDGKCAFCDWAYREAHHAEFVWEFSAEIEHGNPLLGMGESAVWATYDIDCTGVGGSYIAATAPIPVYE